MMALILSTGADTQIVHQFSRLQLMNHWWQWFLLVAIAVALVAYVAYMYRKDCVELPRGFAWGLFALRCAALAGILFYFLDFEKREERQITRSSRAMVLVDTSLSMGIQDSDSVSGGRRIDQVIDAFKNGPLLEQLRENHQVVVYRFDQQTAPVEIASFTRTARDRQDLDQNAQASLRQRLFESRTIAAIAGFLFLSGLVSFAIYLVWGRRARASRVSKLRQDEGEADADGSWSWLVGIVAMIAGIVVLSVASLRHPDLELSAILGLHTPRVAAVAEEKGPAGNTETATVELDEKDIDWSAPLTPRGAETRLGDALRFVINKERGGPIAGVIVLTDGGSNAGSNSQESIAAARASGIPIYCIGLGSEQRPTNARVVDLEAPPRVYPGDAFQLTGFVQSFGLAGRSLKVDLASTPADDKQAQPVIEDSQQITLGPDGELTPIKFEITPTQNGTRAYSLRLVPPAQDSDERDNEKSATVQVIERKSRVLLFAGTATRDFQFLRNMLFRDKSTSVDVLLQSGVPGISQEADELLFDFPKLAEEMFEYDCIVAFDPDWTLLDETQTDLLERWVAEKAGGLLLVAGTVETPKLMSVRGSGSKVETIRSLYPVAFFTRGSATLSLSRMSSESPWQLTFTREGQEADFLRLEDDPLENERAWASYSGVFGYFAVKGAKPGAKVFTRFSDPTTAIDGEQPVYMAAQFYGAGRVFFQGSGEVWRLREADDSYFERYYTKLIRWASQGRLLRDSSRGLLLADKDRALVGETVSLQAVLTDSQHEPLTVAEVVAILVHPDGRRSNLPLRRVENAARSGSYAGQFTTPLEGDYRIELAIPGAGDELLTREVRARIPALETERPERNDALLKEIAQKTGGAYYVGVSSATNRGSGLPPIASLLEPQDQVTYLPGTPDKEFDRLLMTWLMGIICGALCVEWLIRRLVKLA